MIFYEKELDIQIILAFICIARECDVGLYGYK
jgi:hypothetical protein